MGLSPAHATTMAGCWGHTFYNSSASALDSSVYTYNVGNQRASVTRTGENAANYAYDSIGQVIADQASEVSGGANRLNEQLHYIFDPAGNLVTVRTIALVANFHVNSVNRLTSSNTNGGTLTVVECATTSPASSVTVNGTSASLYGDATFAAGGLAPQQRRTATASDGLWPAQHEHGDGQPCDQCRLSVKRQQQPTTD